MNKILLPVLAVVALIVVGGAAFFLLNSSNEEAIDPNSVSASSCKDYIAGEEIDYTIGMAHLKYDPNEIQGSPGETIVIKLVNEERDSHDFVIDDLTVESDLLEESGECQIIRIEIPEDVTVGETFEYYCSFEDHREKGMVGTLEII